MADVIAPSKTVKFTIKSEPRRAGERRTLERLMRMQPEIQKGLRKLAKRRGRDENYDRRRAGGTWTVRVKSTRLARVAKGETFTLRLTPQILPDVKSVAKYLDAKASR